MCSWQRRIAAEVSRSHTFVCVDWSWISSVQSHIFASTNGATVAKWDCVVDFLPVYYVVSLPRLSWTVFTTLCNTRHMCECIENSLSSITAPHRKGMLEGSSSEEADGLCRLLVHDHWIACIFFFFLSSSSFFFFLQLALFLPSEILQAVRAGVPGRVHCGEDALRHPPQTLSQRTQKGI